MAFTLDNMGFLVDGVEYKASLTGSGHALPRGVSTAVRNYYKTERNNCVKLISNVFSDLRLCSK